MVRTCRARRCPLPRRRPCASEPRHAPSTWPFLWQPWPRLRCCARGRAAPSPQCALQPPWHPPPARCTHQRSKPLQHRPRVSTRLFFFALDFHRDGSLASYRCAHRRSSCHLAALRLLRRRCSELVSCLRCAGVAQAPRTSRAAAISAARRSARAASLALRRCSSTARSFCACVSSLPAAGGGATAATSPSARAKSAAHGWKTWRACTGVRRTPGRPALSHCITATRQGMLTRTAAASTATSAGARRSDASGASVDSRRGLGPTAVAVTAHARRECAECFLCAAMRVARRPGAAPATAVACASSTGALTAATSGTMRPAEKRRLEERDLAIWGGPTRLAGSVLRLGRLADG